MALFINKIGARTEKHDSGGVNDDVNIATVLMWRGEPVLQISPFLFFTFCLTVPHSKSNCNICKFLFNRQMNVKIKFDKILHLSRLKNITFSVLCCSKSSVPLPSP